MNYGMTAPKHTSKCTGAQTVPNADSESTEEAPFELQTSARADSAAFTWSDVSAARNTAAFSRDQSRHSAVEYAFRRISGA